MFTNVYNSFLQWLYTLIESLPSVPSDPSILSAYQNVMSTLQPYIINGVCILRFFFGTDTVQLMGKILALTLLLEPFKWAWSFFWWFIRKIPFISVRE